MAIPESQLDTWACQGSIAQSSDTYQSVRRALLSPDSGYADKSFDVYLQGSYRNDTNIYAESDVDIVVQLDSIFRPDTTNLTESEKRAYQSQFSAATYRFDEFKSAVVAHIRRWFGPGAVSLGNKAVRIKGDKARRAVDLVVCYEYRRFNSFSLQNTRDYESGIIFPTPSGETINYPRQHSDNLTSQHQATDSMLKPMVRILKNMRSRMVGSGLLGEGMAPSYYVEGLFYNVPRTEYDAASYGETFVKGINWLLRLDPAKLLCANRQYYLLGNSNVQWNSGDFNSFLRAACAFWSDW